MAQTSSSQLRRTLGLPQLAFYGVGTIVGAGIYSVIGAAAGQAGTYLWASFLLAGIAAFLTVLSYAELASALPKAGGEYQFIKFAFRRWPLLAVIVGVLIAMNASATAATVSIAFAGYLNVFFDFPGMVISFTLLAICTAINIYGIRESTWVSIGLICIEVGGLVLIIACGAVGGTSENLSRDIGEFDVASTFGAAALIFFVYIGFEDIINLSEETRAPKRNVPRALLISVVTTSVLYLLVALSVTALVPAEGLASSQSPLETAASTVSPVAGKALAVTALFATASTALICLISISRLLFAMARDGNMPHVLARVLPKRKTPWVAALTLLMLASALVPLGRVEIVASISSFGILLVFIVVQATVIKLRYSKPDLARSFRVPLTLGTLPLPPVLGIAACAALITQFESVVYMVGTGAIALGGVIYLSHRLFVAR